MSKKMIIGTSVVGISTVLLVLLLVWAVLYGPLVVLRFRMTYEEKLRLESPDGKLDMVWIQGDAGAMTSTRDFIYIVPHKQKPRKKDIVIFKATSLIGLNASWKNDQELVLQYEEAKIHHFQSFLYPFSGNAKYYMIEISEEKIKK